MKKTFVLLVGAALLCGLTTGDIWARGGGGGGGGHGGGGGGHGGGFGGGHGGGFGGGYGRGGYGGYGGGYGGYGGFGYGGYGGFGYGLGLGYGLGYGGYGGGYGGYGGGYGGGYPYAVYSPNYYYDSYYPAPTYNNPYPTPSPMPSPMPYPTTYNSYYLASPGTAPNNSYAATQPVVPAAAAPTTAPIKLEVIVPNSQAHVWVDGQLTSTTGADRVYSTSPVETGYSYTYNVRVSWNQDGQPMTAERQVSVTPGRLNRIDFTRNVNVGSTSAQ